MPHHAVEHAVFLKRIGVEFDPHFLINVDETRIRVIDPDLGQQRFAMRHDGQHHGAGRHHCARRVCGKILDEARLRRPQLKQAVLVAVFGQLLRHLVVLRLRLHPLVV